MPFATPLLVAASFFAADGPPNIVLVIADDCTYSDLGCYGGQAATPNLDRLCGEGMRFERCYQAAPMCSPTRHCLYTGLYPVKSGAYPNHTFVHEGTKSVAHYLQAAGYRTALSGKTHISPRSSFPFEYSADGKETHGTNPNFDTIASLVAESKEAGQPFAAFLCSNEPHSPYNEGDASAYPPALVTLPPHYVDTPETRVQFSKYLAEITYFDSQVGRVLALLDEQGVTDNTLVMVLSEQGSGFPFAKWTCYEVGVRSGMIVRWPGRVKAGVTSDAIVEYVDVTPTFVEVSGQQPVSGLDGRSFVDVLTGESSKHKQYTFSLQTTRGINNGADTYGIRSVRGERYRLVRNLSPEVAFKNAVFTTPYWKEWEQRAAGGDEHAAKWVGRYINRPAVELYDCENDLWNMTNLADDPALADVRAELSRQLDEWMAQQGDEGQQTELRALERQGRARKKKKAGGKKRKKAA